MSEAAPRQMTLAEFLEWQRGQQQRYELVDGSPQAMTSARRRHDVARGNAEAWLRPALRNAGQGCLPFGADLGIQVAAAVGAVRRYRHPAGMAQAGGVNCNLPRSQRQRPLRADSPG